MCVMTHLPHTAIKGYMMAILRKKKRKPYLVDNKYHSKARTLHRLLCAKMQIIERHQKGCLLPTIGAWKLKTASTNFELILGAANISCNGSLYANTSLFTEQRPEWHICQADLNRIKPLVNDTPGWMLCSNAPAIGNMKYCTCVYYVGVNEVSAALLRRFVGTDRVHVFTICLFERHRPPHVN